MRRSDPKAAKVTPAIAPPAARQPGAHVPELDGLRGVAILMVVGQHCAISLPAPTSGWIGSAYNVLAGYGWAGVDLFFVLSGYLITGILLRTRESSHYMRDFYARRVLRIFPLYYAFVLWRLFVSPAWVTDHVEQLAYLTYWSNIWLALHPGSMVELGLAVTWSLAIEEQFYLLWPLLVLRLGRRTLAAVAITLVAVALGLRALSQPAGLPFLAYYFTLCRFDGLAIGSLLALLRPWPARTARLALAAAAVLLSVIAVLDHGFHNTAGTWMLYFGCTLNAVASASLLSLALANGLLAAIFRSRLLRLFGKYSYSIYLLHVPIILLLNPLGGDGVRPVEWLRWFDSTTGGLLPSWLTFLLLVATVLLLVGAASWHLFEKRILALKVHFGGA